MDISTILGGTVLKGDGIPNRNFLQFEQFCFWNGIRSSDQIDTNIICTTILAQLINRELILFCRMFAKVWEYTHVPSIILIIWIKKLK